MSLIRLEGLRRFWDKFKSESIAFTALLQQTGRWFHSLLFSEGWQRFAGEACGWLKWTLTVPEDLSCYNHLCWEISMISIFSWGCLGGNTFLINTILANEMAQLAKVFAAKHDNSPSVPGTHVVRGERLAALPSCPVMSTCAPAPHTHSKM